MVRLRGLRLLAMLAALAIVAMGCGEEDAPEAEPEDEATETEMEEEPTEPEDEAEPTEPEMSEELRLGYLLPETGQLAFLGPAQITAVEMAVAEINEAGGVLGSDVFLTGADEAGDAAVASTAVDRLLADNVQAIIGAAASGMTLAVIDKIVGAGVLQCSASNTAPTLTDYDDDGLYFRTAPSDALQGPVLAETIIGDGYSQVALMGRADDYGQGLVDATANALTEAGADVVASVIFDPEAASFSAEVEQVAAASPDAVVVVSFDEGVQILQELIEAGLGPADVGVYGVDGNRDEEYAASVDPGNPNVIDGFKGTAPDTAVDEGWRARFDEFSGEQPIFSAQAFDCVTLVALAAEAAGSTDPAAMAAEVIGLTRGDTECTGFAECRDLIQDGTSINYVAASGFDQFTDAGEPNGGLYEVWAWEDGELVVIDSVESFLE
jgi:branched-chain amino acid transport system substrate-binding protein